MYYLKKILFFVLFSLFSAVICGEDSRRIEELLYNKVESCFDSFYETTGIGSGEEFVQKAGGILQDFIVTLIHDKSYRWRYRDNGLKAHDYGALIQAYFDFMREESKRQSEGAANNALLREKFIRTNKNEFDNKITPDLLKFLEDSFEKINMYIERKKVSLLSIPKKEKDVYSLGEFFSSESAIEKSQDPSFFFAISAHGEDIFPKNVKESSLRVNVGRELKNRGLEGFLDFIKEKSSTEEIVLVVEHLDNYNFHYLKKLKFFLDEVKERGNKNIVIECKTNFQNVKEVYEEVFSHKHPQRTNYFFVDTAVSLKYHLGERENQNLYFFSRKEDIIVERKKLVADKTNIIHIFFDYELSKKSHDLLIKKIKEENFAYPIEVISYFSDRLKCEEYEITKKIPSFFQSDCIKRNKHFQEFSIEEKKQFENIVKRLAYSVDANEVKEALRDKKNFDETKKALLSLYFQENHYSEFHQIKNKNTSYIEQFLDEDAKKNLAMNQIFYFENDLYNEHEHVDQEIKKFISGVESYKKKDSFLTIDALQELKRGIEAIGDRIGKAGSRQELLVLIKKNLDTLSQKSVFIDATEYVILNEYALEKFLQSEIKPRFIGENNNTQDRGSQDRFYEQAQKDIEEIKNQYIQLLFENANRMKIIFCGLKSRLGGKKAFSVPVSYFSFSHNKEVIKNFVRENVVSEFFVASILNEFPIPYYFSLKEKNNLLFFMLTKYNDYKAGVNKARFKSEEEIQQAFLRDQNTEHEYAVFLKSTIKSVVRGSLSTTLKDIIEKYEEIYLPLEWPHEVEKITNSIGDTISEVEKKIHTYFYKNLNKDFSSEEVRKVRIAFQAQRFEEHRFFEILDEIISHAAINKSFSNKTTLELTDHIVNNLYYSALVKEKQELTDKIAVNSFYRIEQANPRYDSTLLHSLLKKHIIEKFTLFKKDRSYCLTFNIGGATGVGKTEGLNEVRKQLREVVGQEPVVITLTEVEDKFVGSAHEHLDELYKDIEKFILEGRYVILHSDEVDVLVGQGGGGSVDSQRNNAKSGKFKQFFTRLNKEFGSRVVLYSTSNHRMIIGNNADGNTRKQNSEHNGVYVEDAVIGRLGQQLWIPSMELKQFIAAYKNNMAKMKRVGVYEKAILLFERELDKIQSTGALECGAETVFYENYFFNKYEANKTALRGADERLRKFFEYIELVENKDKSIQTLSREFKASEDREQFREIMRTFWSKNNVVENYTQMQDQKMGALIGRAAGGLLAATVFNTEQKKAFAGMLPSLGEGLGAGFDSMNKEADRQELTLDSRKFLTQKLISDETEGTKKTILHLAGLLCQKAMAGYFNKNGIPYIKMTQEIDEYIYRQIYGTELNAKRAQEISEAADKKLTISNFSEWLRRKNKYGEYNLKMKSPFLYTVFYDENRIGKEIAEYYLSLFSNSVTPYSYVSKEIIIDRLNHFNEYFKKSQNKNHMISLLNKHAGAKIQFQKDKDKVSEKNIEETKEDIMKALIFINGSGIIKKIAKDAQEVANSSTVQFLSSFNKKDEVEGLSLGEILERYH